MISLESGNISTTIFPRIQRVHSKTHVKKLKKDPEANE